MDGEKEDGEKEDWGSLIK